MESFNIKIKSKHLKNTAKKKDFINIANELSKSDEMEKKLQLKKMAEKENEKRRNF